jgi:hypothetical protein
LVVRDTAKKLKATLSVLWHRGETIDEVGVIGLERTPAKRLSHKNFVA